jgi:isoaspartyl peptidase/L-asparaginase-like protein (Ntn-hydrolase superfamily)
MKMTEKKMMMTTTKWKEKKKQQQQQQQNKKREKKKVANKKENAHLRSMPVHSSHTVSAVVRDESVSSYSAGRVQSPWRE